MEALFDPQEVSGAAKQVGARSEKAAQFRVHAFHTGCLVRVGCILQVPLFLNTGVLLFEKSRLSKQIK